MTTVSSEGIDVITPEQEQKETRRLPRWIRRFIRNPVSLMGFLLVIFFAVVALLAPVLAPPKIPNAPYQIPRAGFFAQPQPPSAKAPFGTTEGQYNIFYGVVWGTRTAFKVGLIVTSVCVLIGGLLGAATAFAGGWADEITQRIVELFLAFPFLLAALTLATVLGPKVRNGLITGMIALIVFGWPGYARLIRSEVLSVKEREFVLASKALGSSGMRTLISHVIPNSMYSLLVVASLDIGTNVLTFAALSFLGVGVETGYADWGQLLSFARNWIPNLSQYSYIVVYPGMALLLFVLAWNLIGDAFRDALDPRLQGK